MLALVVRRVAQGVLTVVFAATLAFFLLHLAPGNPVDATVNQPGMPAPFRAQMIHQWGLDRPVGEQYVRYVLSVFRGDLGWSFSAKRPVSAVLGDALPVTLVLAGTGIALSLAAGVAIGVVQTLRRGRPADRLLGAGAMFFYSVPEFWLGLALLLVFSYGLAQIGRAHV